MYVYKRENIDSRTSYKSNKSIINIDSEWYATKQDKILMLITGSVFAVILIAIFLYIL